MRQPRQGLSRSRGRPKPGVSRCKDEPILVGIVVNLSCAGEDVTLEDGKVFNAETIEL